MQGVSGLLSIYYRVAIHLNKYKKNVFGPYKFITHAHFSAIAKSALFRLATTSPTH